MASRATIQWSIAFTLALGVLAGLYFQDDLAGFGRAAKERILGAEQAARNFVVTELDRRVITGEPLFGPRQQQGGDLTVAGVIMFTNEHRAENGLAPLSTSAALNESASIKVQDMFDRQYFAHEAPTGEGVSELADEAGYHFMVVAENLALGNFESDEALVQAWMDSPGHRANIVDERYQDIGVAVKKGMYEGAPVWIAVQHFGLASSVCPAAPSETTLNTIEYNEQQLEYMKLELEAREEEIQNMWPKRGNAYEQKVKEYEQLIAEYNTLVKETKELGERYNDQARAFNACVQNNR